MKRSKLQPVAPHESLAYWLGRVCQSGRELRNLRLGDVGRGRIDNGTLSRFENEPKWNRNPEAIVACYAEAFNVEDSRSLWHIALEAWRERGKMPHAPKLPSEEEAVSQTVEQLAQGILGVLQKHEVDQHEPDTEPDEAEKSSEAAG